jgi:hypothetical protein
MIFSTTLLLSMIPFNLAYYSVPRREADYFRKLVPEMRTYRVTETIRQHHDSAMDVTQCGTPGRDEDVIGIDDTAFGSVRNGEKPSRCGKWVKLMFYKKGESTPQIAYGRLQDRIWENAGVGFKSKQELQNFHHRMGSYSPADDRAYNFGYHQIDLSAQLHKKLGGRDGVNLDYDGHLEIMICNSDSRQC